MAVLVLLSLFLDCIANAGEADVDNIAELLLSVTGDANCGHGVISHLHQHGLQPRCTTVVNGRPTTRIFPREMRDSGDKLVIEASNM